MKFKNDTYTYVVVVVVVVVVGEASDTEVALVPVETE